MYQRRLICLVISILVLSCSAMDADGNDTLPGFDGSLFYDMFLPHEGIPAGVPDSYNWKLNPLVGFGANIPSGWNAITAWGQVYAEQGMPNPDKDFPLVRVHIKDLQLFILRNNGSWYLVQDVKNPIGYLYLEDFVDDEHKPAHIEYEKEGGISVQAGSGYCFHFYPESISEIDPNDIKGVFVVCKARLIGTENYETVPKYLIDVGADYWRTTTAEWAADWSSNDGVGLGRFKYVTAEWQYHIMHTFSQKEAGLVVLPLEQ